MYVLIPGLPSLIIIFVTTLFEALDFFIIDELILLLFEFSPEWDWEDKDGVKNEVVENVKIDLASANADVDAFCHISNNDDEFCDLLCISELYTGGGAILDSDDKWDVNCLKFKNCVDPRIGWLVIFNSILFSIIDFGVVDDGDI